MTYAGQSYIIRQCVVLMCMPLMHSRFQGTSPFYHHWEGWDPSTITWSVKQVEAAIRLGRHFHQELIITLWGWFKHTKKTTLTLKWKVDDHGCSNYRIACLELSELNSGSFLAIRRQAPYTIPFCSALTPLNSLETLISLLVPTTLYSNTHLQACASRRFCQVNIWCREDMSILTRQFTSYIQVQAWEAITLQPLLMWSV